MFGGMPDGTPWASARLVVLLRKDSLFLKRARDSLPCLCHSSRRNRASGSVLPSCDDASDNDEEAGTEKGHEEGNPELGLALHKQAH